MTKGPSSESRAPNCKKTRAPKIILTIYSAGGVFLIFGALVFNEIATMDPEYRPS